MVRIFGTGDYNVAILDMPAQNDLRIGLAILLTQLREQVFFQQRFVAVAQGIPGLHVNSFFRQKLLQFLLLKIGMHFGLEDCGLHFA